MLSEKKDKIEKKKLILVAGARPNFMKIAPLMKALLKSERWLSVLVHTGQHYDFKMSDVFFKELKIPTPDIFLNVGAGSHASQTAAIMQAFEKVVLKERPALVVVGPRNPLCGARTLDHAWSQFFEPKSRPRSRRPTR